MVLSIEFRAVLYLLEVFFFFFNLLCVNKFRVFGILKSLNESLTFTTGIHVAVVHNGKFTVTV